MQTIIKTLLLALETKYISIDFIHRWSESLIENSNNPKNWLIDLTTSYTEKEMLSTLKKLELEFYWEKPYFKEIYEEILLGFYYLSFKNENIDSTEFISSLIDNVDAYEITNIDLENILIDYDKSYSIENINLKVLSMLEAFSIRSKKLFNYLINSSFYNKEIKNIEK